MNSHQLLTFTYDNDAARYCRIQNYDDKWELTDGMVIGDDYPPDVEFTMNENFPDFVGRNDFLHTNGKYLVVQSRVRELFEQQGVPHLQFLDVVVKDHKGRKVPETFWLVNITEHVDCIDQDATKFEWNTLDDEKMTEVSNLTLSNTTLSGVLLSRAKFLPKLLIIATSLADQMKVAGFTGFEAKELSESKP